MSGILVPVIIHLWNQREGKTVKVGSIALLQESARQQARSLRLKDLLLLLLRCLLIVALAFLLAKPVWRKQLSAGTEKGWLLIERGGVKDAYRQHKPVIDSLLAAGFRFHYFAAGFPAAEWQQALQNPIDTTLQRSASYWTLVKQLNEDVPAELPVYLFTTNQLVRYAGQRPQVDMQLTWLPYTTPDTATNQAVKVFKTSDGQLRTLTAHSTPQATLYTQDANVDRATQLAVLWDTAALRIAIYSDGFNTDAGYLRAAISAIKQVTGRAITVTQLRNANELASELDWLFWLSEKPLPAPLPAHVFYYKKGKEEAIHSFLSKTRDMAHAGEPIRLSRRTSFSATEGQAPVWSDGFGNTLLTVNGTEKKQYAFHSRLNPAWNDLPWSASFVYLLYDLLLPHSGNKKIEDLRIIDAQQMQVQRLNGKEFDKEKFVESTDLTHLFWVLAFVLFAVERIVSLTPKNQPNG
jgi:hypothetical protein